MNQLILAFNSIQACRSVLCGMVTRTLRVLRACLDEGTCTQVHGCMREDQRLAIMHEYRVILFVTFMGHGGALCSRCLHHKLIQ